MKKGNFFTAPESSGTLTDEFFGELLKGRAFRLEKIVSAGHITPKDSWYDQEADEWVLLVRGEAAIEFEDCTVVELKAGDFLQIDAHERHRVIYTSAEPSCCWLALHGSFES